MMNFTEKTVSQEEKYHGILVNIRLDQIELPNGKPALREVCEHCGGVGVLPIDGEGNVILVRQHRYAYHLDILEIPAGKMDHGAEDHRACGIRELKEETGCTADEIYYLGEMYPSPGFLEEIAYLYAAKGLTYGECQPDEDEFVEHVKLPIAEVEKMILDGTIKDAKTITAMYRARLAGLL